MFTACWKFPLGFILFGAMISHIGDLQGGWEWFLFLLVFLVGLAWLLEGAALFFTGVLELIGDILRTFGKLPEGASPQEQKEQIRRELAGFAGGLDEKLRKRNQGTAESKLEEGLVLTIDVKGISKEAVQPYVDDFIRRTAGYGWQLSATVKEKE